MTAPLEVLRDAIDRCARGRQSYVTLSLDDAVPILTAIEERDAEIATLARQLAEAQAQRDAMRWALREVRENLAALLAHHERRHDDAVRDGMREGVTRIDRALGAL